MLVIFEIHMGRKLLSSQELQFKCKRVGTRSEPSSTNENVNIRGCFLEIKPSARCFEYYSVSQSHRRIIVPRSVYIKYMTSRKKITAFA